ncbi:hypothetical protein QQP08_007195 [Theobroma cacao]|nr:hypothetical protein QQP08_007195 [Theobroma cacao]
MAALRLSDELLGPVILVVVDWVYSGMYMAFGSCDNYRLHPKQEEDEKNLVSKKTVIKGVLLIQFLQITAAILLYMVTGGNDGSHLPSLL